MMTPVSVANRHTDLTGKPRWKITLACGHTANIKRKDGVLPPKRMKCRQCPPPAAARESELEQAKCEHGWRGTVPENGKRIVTPCPSCGRRCLFIGTGGHLTCSYLGPECREPAVERMIESIKAKLATRDREVAELREALGKAVEAGEFILTEHFANKDEENGMRLVLSSVRSVVDAALSRTPGDEPLWTKEPPTKPGDYYWRNTESTLRVVVQAHGGLMALRDEDDYLIDVEEFGGEWSGPLVPPANGA